MTTRFQSALRRAFKSFRQFLAEPPTPADPRIATLVATGRHTYPSELSIVTWPPYSARLVVGSFCSIGEQVEFFLDTDHRSDWVTTSPIRILFELEGAEHDGHPTTRGDITIGNDVWIGRGAIILSGVTVGDGAVVGARAVVSKDVEPYAIVVGNPARVARYRFPDDVIEALLRIRWWEWPDSVIEQRVGELCSTEIRAFVENHDPPALATDNQPRPGAGFVGPTRGDRV